MHPHALCTLALVLAGLTTTAAAAPPRAGGGGPRPGGQGMAGGGAGQAAEQARRQTGGRVLSVREGSGGYQVKVLTPNGEVRSVFVPGTGR